MIQINTIKIKNYRSIGDMELKIDGQGLVSICGLNLDDPLSPGNGVGKSTILSSIQWGLFGISTDGDKADDILSWTMPKDCSTEISIIKDGRVAEIARYRKDKNHGNNIYFTVDGQPVNAAKNKDIQPLIDAFLGFDVNVFSLLLTMGGLSKNAEPFMYMNDSGRKEFTDFLLNLEYLSVCLKEITADIKNMESDIATAISDTEKKTIMYDSLKSKIEEYTEMSDRWKAAHEESIQNNKNAIAKAIQLIQDNKAALTELNEEMGKEQINNAQLNRTNLDLSNNYAAQNANINNVKNSIVEVQNAIKIEEVKLTEDRISPEEQHNIVCTEYDKEIEETQKSLNDAEKNAIVIIENRTGLIMNRHHFIADFEAVSEELNAFGNIIDRNTLQVGILKSEAAAVKKEHDEAKEFLSTGNLQCPQCKQAVNVEHLEGVIEAAKTAYNIKIDTIKQLQDEAKKARVDKDALRLKTQNDNATLVDSRIANLDENILTAQSTIDKLKASLEALIDQKGKGTDKLREAKYAEYKEKEAARIKTIEDAIYKLKESLAIHNTSLSMRQTELSKITSELVNISTELTASKNNLIHIEGRIKSNNIYIANLESALNLNNQQLLGEQQKQNHYTDLINKNVLLLNEQSDIIKNNAAKLATLRQDIDYLYFWKEGFSTAGLKSYILDSVTALLDTKANDCLSKLSSSLLVKFVTQDTLKSGDVRDKFDVNIYNNGNKTQFYKLSSGQRARVSFAVNFALKVLAEYYHNIKINFTFIDEALDNLDSVGIQQVIHSLREQLNKYTSIFVVSHNDELKSLFDKTLLLLYENGVSRLDD